MALTDAVVRQTRITGKDYTLNDADGLVLFVTGSGAKKWHFRFTWLGKQQRSAIGSYPELSFKEAREQRDDLRAQVARRTDPRIHRLQAKGGGIGCIAEDLRGGLQDLARFQGPEPDARSAKHAVADQSHF